MKIKITKLQLAAIEDLLAMAKDNSCSCISEAAGNTDYRAGYDEHDRSCWVHLHRNAFKHVEKFLKGKQ